jgi:hypothetical protein
VAAQIALLIAVRHDLVFEGLKPLHPTNILAHQGEYKAKLHAAYGEP